MNNRILLTAIISSDKFPYDDVLDSLSPKLGEHFAGACCQRIDGVWSEDGHQFKEIYTHGKIETGMIIRVSVIPEKSQSSINTLKTLLSNVNKEMQLEISWVHLESSVIDVHHFCL